jgi:hypothetical protein
MVKTRRLLKKKNKSRRGGAGILTSRPNSKKNYTPLQLRQFLNKKLDYIHKNFSTIDDKRLEMLKEDIKKLYNEIGKEDKLLNQKYDEVINIIYDKLHKLTAHSDGPPHTY